MKKIKEFQPKVGKLSFREVAKASGISGLKLSRKDFRVKAAQVLEQAGFGQIETKGILSGARKLSQEKAKRAFNKLRAAGVIKKGRTAVTSYIQRQKQSQRQAHEAEQKILQQRIKGQRQRERVKEIEAERETAAKASLRENQNQGPEIFYPSPAPSPKFRTSNNSSQLSLPTIKPQAKKTVKLPQEDEQIERLRKQAEEQDLPLD